MHERELKKIMNFAKIIETLTHHLTIQIIDLPSNCNH